MNKRNLWILLLCCLLPIIGLAAILLFKIPVNTVIYFGLLLLYLPAHFFIMGRIRTHNKNEHGEHVHAGIEDGK